MKETNSARSVAWQLLEAVQERESYANLLLPKLLSQAKLEAADAGFAQELAFGVLRNQSLYDAIIERASKRSTKELDGNLLLALRLGAHQLLAMRVPDHAAIFETVELAKSRLNPKVVPLVNAVLRRVSERSREEWLDVLLAGVKGTAERLALEYSHPAWIVSAFQEALELDGIADELPELIATDNEIPKVSLVALPGRCETHELEHFGFGGNNASPIGAELASGDPGTIPAVLQNRMRVQDQGSQLAALLVAEVTPINPGEAWLDLCAGPGGKAAILASLANRSGVDFFANELQAHRVGLVRTALSGTGFNQERLTGVDATSPELVRQATARADFDRILLDAPCSGLGALRRRPEARWRKQPSDIKELVQLQRELLESAFSLLAPGGILGYVTCSPHPAETNGQVAWLLKRFGASAELLDAKAPMLRLNGNLELNPKRLTVQLWPQRHGTDAMFIALVRNLG